MKTVALVQCRTASTRLPGKALADLNGKPVIQHVLERMHVAERIDKIVLATTKERSDDELVWLVRGWGVNVYRGPERDVLRRLCEAAMWFEADKVVRICGDCPFIEPQVIDEVIDALDRDVDAASNVVRRTYPKGLDCEALWMDTLRRLDRLTRSRNEAPLRLLYERPELFLMRSVETDDRDPTTNYCVDTAADLERMQASCVS